MHTTITHTLKRRGKKKRWTKYEKNSELHNVINYFLVVDVYLIYFEMIIVIKYIVYRKILHPNGTMYTQINRLIHIRREACKWEESFWIKKPDVKKEEEEERIF